MAKQTINLGTNPNDGTGSNLRAGGLIVNNNFNELYTALGDGSALNISTASASTDNVLKWNGSSFVPGALALELSADSTPQLGGNLDINGNSIVSTSNGNIAITPNGSGKVILDGLSHPTADGSAGQFLKTDGSGNLSFSTVTSTFTLAADSGSNDTVTVGTDTLTFEGTANEIETTVSDNKINIGFPTNVTISGNLTVSGTTTTVSSTTVNVADSMLALATGNNSSDSIDIGFYGLYDDSGSQDEYSGLFRDAGDQKWKLFKNLQAAPTTTVDTSGTGYAVATLIADIETANAAITGGTITGITDLAVADGGTGLSAAAKGSVLVANTANTLSALDGGGSNDGILLYTSSSDTISWTTTIDGGTYS